ncbi:DMT family transporter [Halorussus limi]|uniref:DMT family transporter n=1 Tax=Halorussus limi TaxID=2938695 RepID=A0A8U0HRL9_9EURY|nr:DMT family transporter [Halorussus limi]UPV73537.1 DMT family transporter [Halorussus limi]
MSRYRDAGLFAFLAAAWGGSFVAIEVGLDSLPPLLFAALRYDFGAVLLVAYAAVARDRWLPRTRGDYRSILVIGVFLITAANGLLFVGQQYTTGGVAAILYSLNPVLTTGFARSLLPDDRLSPLGLLGLLVGLAGVALVVRPDPANLLAGTTGKLLVVLSAASVALGSVLLRRTAPTADSVATTGWGMAVGALLMHGASLVGGETPRVADVLDPQVLLPLGYLAVVATAAAYAVYFGLLERHSPVQVNLVSYLVPIVTAVAGWLLLDESLTAPTVVGFLVVLVGFSLVKREALAGFVSRRAA